MRHAALVLSLIGVVASSAIADQSTGSQPSPARRIRVAVLDFDYATVHSNAAAIFGSNVDVGRGVTDLLVTYLVKDGSYSVVERKALAAVMAEQNFSNSDRADPSTAARIGKMLGVDAIIVGSITQFGNETKNRGVGGGGAAIGGLGLGRFNQKEGKAVVGLTARMVNVDTGEILAAVEGDGESKRKSVSVGGVGGGWRGFGAGDVNFGSSDFQNTIIGEAVKEAVEDTTAELIRQRSRVVARAVTVQGLVAAVDGGQIILNVGGSVGVKVGDRLSVQRTSQEIKDPATGKVIRRLSTEIGVLRVTEVDDESSVAEVESGSGFRVSDIVRTAAPK
jgi:curli biogenesis system outer membrane secretion channel CsgG